MIKQTNTVTVLLGLYTVYWPGAFLNLSFSFCLTSFLSRWVQAKSLVNLSFSFLSSDLGCVLEGLTNKKERDKIGKEGEK